MFWSSPPKGKNAPVDLTNEKTCSAEIIRLSDDTVAATGSYDSNTMVHAEMDAISNYLMAGGSLDNIKTINISSSPCNSCAFILMLLGLTNHVRFDTGRFTSSTGSWDLPENLESLELYRGKTNWDVIKKSMIGQG